MKKVLHLHIEVILPLSGRLKGGDPAQIEDDKCRCCVPVVHLELWCTLSLKARLAVEWVKKFWNSLSLSLSMSDEKGLHHDHQENMPNPSHIPKTFLTRNVPKLKSDQCMIVVMYNLKRWKENLVLYKICGLHLWAFQFPQILTHFHISFLAAHNLRIASQPTLVSGFIFKGL